MPDNTAIISTIEDALGFVRSQLEAFASGQNENSDEANEDLLQEAEQALENLETIVSSLVP